MPRKYVCARARTDDPFIKMQTQKLQYDQANAAAATAHTGVDYDHRVARGMVCTFR